MENVLQIGVKDSCLSIQFISEESKIVQAISCEEPVKRY